MSTSTNTTSLSSPQPLASSIGRPLTIYPGSSRQLLADVNLLQPLPTTNLRSHDSEVMIIDDNDTNNINNNPSNIKQTRLSWKPKGEPEITLLKLAIANRPFSSNKNDRRRLWEKVSNELNRIFKSSSYDWRNCRDHLAIVMKKYTKEDAKNSTSSGIEEVVDEWTQLCSELVLSYNAAERVRDAVKVTNEAMKRDDDIEKQHQQI